MTDQTRTDTRFSSNDHGSDNDGVVVFGASYTAKDLILYALSIGFGSSRARYQHDLRFLYEDHPEFTAVPMFGLVLLFWAQPIHEINDNGGARIQPAADDALIRCCSDLPAFPPPMMRCMGVLPRRFWRQNETLDLEDYPILHTFQSIVFHNDMRVPGGRKKQEATAVQTLLQGRYVSVVPRSVGTFVTTETTIDEYIPKMANNDNAKQSTSVSRVRPLCTVQSTVLILGLDKDLVMPWVAPSTHSSNQTANIWNDTQREMMILDETCTMDPNQALLYRLASGDTNAIHVDPSAVPLSSDDTIIDSSSSAPAADRPLLHGLCTMGIAARIIMQNLESHGRLRNLSMRRLEGRFVKPVFVGDSIVVQAWKLTAKTKKSNAYSRSSSRSKNSQLCIEFLVRNEKTGDNVLDSGRILFVPNTMPSRL